MPSSAELLYTLYIYCILQHSVYSHTHSKISGTEYNHLTKLRGRMLVIVAQVRPVTSQMTYTPDH